MPSRISNKITSCYPRVDALLSEISRVASNRFKKLHNYLNYKDFDW